MSLIVKPSVRNEIKPQEHFCGSGLDCLIDSLLDGLEISRPSRGDRVEIIHYNELENRTEKIIFEFTVDSSDPLGYWVIKKLT